MSILNVTHGIIFHQVNSLGSMNVGLAKEIRKKYPSVYKDYKRFEKLVGLKMGDIIVSRINDNLYIVSGVAQNRISGDYLRTDYKALSNALYATNLLSLKFKLPVFVPDHLGCGVGGGNWDIIKSIISKSTQNTYIVDIDGNAIRV